MARSTAEGSPEWLALQALPAETATPAASRAARSLPTARSSPKSETQVTGQALDRMSEEIGMRQRPGEFSGDAHAELRKAHCLAC